MKSNLGMYQKIVVMSKKMQKSYKFSNFGLYLWLCNVKAM